MQNIVAHVKNPYPRIIIISTIINHDTLKYVILDTINQLTVKSLFSNKFILGILNSKLISWYVYRFVFANAIRTMHFDAVTTSKIPFPNINFNNKKEKQLYDKLLKFVETMLELNARKQTVTLQTEKDTLQHRIQHTVNEIDKIVYQLYGLSKSEIDLIEGNNFAG